jgi:hypothetical protein
MDLKKRFIKVKESVVDLETQLMWKHTDSMNDLKKWVNFQDSADYARELRENKFLGFDNWRLPTKEEMETLYDESLTNTDRFDKTIHISDCFAPGGGFTMIAGMVSGRFRTWVYDIREGTFEQPEGLWTITAAARAVRTIGEGESYSNEG